MERVRWVTGRVIIACGLLAWAPATAWGETPTPQPPVRFAPPPLSGQSDRSGINPQHLEYSDPLPINPLLLRPESELNTWWRDKIRQPLGPADAALTMDLDFAVVQALSQSARVRVLRETAAISSTAIPQAQANFDPLSFAESRFTDTSDPVGNKLTTGGAGRFIDQTWYATSGVRRKTLTGAQVEISQRFGFQNNNSLFFVPKDQATARLNLSVTQPLLRGAGQAYNNAIVVLAQLDANMAHNQFSTDLQMYLVEFHKAFWDIYIQRAALLQRRRLLQEAKEVLRELELRRDVDVQGIQLSRARAAVATREASILRYEAGVKNAVARFKSLVNDPFLDRPGIYELIPLDPSDAGYGESDLAASLSTALNCRPEIHQASNEIKASCERLHVAKKDMLPVLNLVMGSYISGLQGQTDFGQAYADQFSVGRPTYWTGLVYERPYGNRAARALRDQRVLELQRATSQLQSVTATVRADVEIAVREVATTRGEMLSRHQAMLSEQDEANYLLQRWRLLAGDQQVAGVVFNNLLDAQERRAAAEFEFVNAQIAHRISWIALKRATGTLCYASAVTASESASGSPPEVVPVPKERAPILPAPDRSTPPSTTLGTAVATPGASRSAMQSNSLVRLPPTISSPAPAGFPQTAPLAPGPLPTQGMPPSFQEPVTARSPAETSVR